MYKYSLKFKKQLDTPLSHFQLVIKDQGKLNYEIKIQFEHKVDIPRIWSKGQQLFHRKESFL